MVDENMPQTESFDYLSDLQVRVLFAKAFNTCDMFAQLESELFLIFSNRKHDDPGSLMSEVFTNQAYIGTYKAIKELGAAVQAIAAK